VGIGALEGVISVVLAFGKGQVLTANADLSTGNQSMLSLIVEPEIPVFRVVEEADTNRSEVDQIHKYGSEVNNPQHTVVKGHIKNTT